MNNKISNVLLKIIDAGFQAYIVGGYVRDYILGIDNYDIDIATSANPKQIRDIFNLNIANDDNYGSVTINDGEYNFDITTYRKEISYNNRRPIEYKYLDNITEDIYRRDFTINSLYMDFLGNIYDITNGQDDIKNKIIRVLGNINDKMFEDPLRMLRGIRFATILDFNLETNFKTFISQNGNLLNNLSFDRKKQELDLIFNHPHCLKGITLIKELKLEKYLGIKTNKIIYTDNYLGIWAQIEFSNDYNFKKNEIDTINYIKKIINYGKIDVLTLYQYGLYPCIIAGDILSINKEDISKIYASLPIYTVKDININGEEIMNILKIKPSNKIKKIINDIEINILNNKLNNNKEEIQKYIINNWS